MLQTAVEPRYLCFILPIVLAVFILILQFIGLLGDDLDIDLDGDGQPDVDFDQSGSSLDLLGFLGVGKAPLSVIVLLLLLLWGGGGLITLILLESVVPYGFVTVWPALVVAAILAFFGTAWLARLIGRLMPRDSTAAINESDLQFQTGLVRELVTSTRGSVRIYDDFGNSQIVEARVINGGSPIPIGDKVVLQRYDDSRRIFYVQSVDYLTGEE